MLRYIAILLSFIALTACSSADPAHESQDVVSFYDYQLYSPDNEPISIDSLPDALTKANVILVGEWHTHSAIHRFQTDLVKQLFRTSPHLTISMEQFARDKQSVLDAYLDGEIGEQTLIKTANGWPNYESDYRALVEFAKSNSLDVIASNAPKPLVRCIGRQGIGYLDKLSNEERQHLAREIETGSSPYKEKFMASMHHGEPEQSERQYAAQVTWDETMAESISDYLKQNPRHQIIHIAGKFHTEQGLGIEASLLRRMPSLNIVVITPTSSPTIEPDNHRDFRLHVLAPPTRYIKAENRLAAFQHLATRNDQLICK
ncbi:ChaN family lipoprotein [Vibrio brasiliensis]